MKGIIGSIESGFNESVYKKVLFIKDSFARLVAGYMSLEAKETRLIDIRHSDESFRKL